MRAGTDPSGDVTDKLVAALDRIARGVRTHRQATATSLGLTPLQLELLRTLAEAPPPRPTPGELAVELGVSQPTLTESIHALQRKGHLERHADPVDRRRTVLKLTDSGDHLAEEAYRADESLRTIFDALDQTDREQLLQAMLATIGTLLDAGVIQVARTCHTRYFFEPRSEGAEPRCGLLDLPLPPADLRVNCPEHVTAHRGGGAG